MNTNYYIKVSVTNLKKKSQSIQLKYNYKKKSIQPYPIDCKGPGPNRGKPADIFAVLGLVYHQSLSLFETLSFSLFCKTRAFLKTLLMVINGKCYRSVCPWSSR